MHTRLLAPVSLHRTGRQAPGYHAAHQRFQRSRTGPLAVRYGIRLQRALETLTETGHLSGCTQAGRVGDRVMTTAGCVYWREESVEQRVHYQALTRFP